MVPTGSAVDRRSTIVVANALAAQQWEMHLAAEPIRGGAPVWETPAVLTYAAWLDQVWLEHAHDRGAALSNAQSFALWRCVLAESDEGSELIEQTGAAEWAAAAWQLLQRWQIDPAQERAAAGQLDYRALLHWCRRYRNRLQEHRWVDRGEIEAALTLHAATGVGAVVVADLAEPYPARTTLFAHLARHGTAITATAAPSLAGQQRAARLADAADELRAAFAWAKRGLAANPAARIAVVVPTVARRHDEIDRLATAEFGALAPQVCWSEGQTLASEPAIGAAFNALTLLAAGTPYAAFGRWLRSPFFATANAEQFARARLDRELRTELRSQLPFQAAYRSGLKEVLAARAPQSAQALAQALGAGAVLRATPSRWAHLWARYLAELGWQPPAANRVLLGWQSTLDELARLTPILGEISLDAALVELQRLHERATATALPLFGVHVLGRIDDVGPGYDAVWVTGFTDAAWPKPPHGNPLLPIALQRAHGMPYSSPLDAQRRSARALERLVQRTAQLVVSWPARVYDFETEPSPAIRAWPLLADVELRALTAASPDAPTPSRETVDDPAPAFCGTRLPGGTGALGRQARCPLRAFCQDRLGARPLEPLGFGLSGRLRGIALPRRCSAACLARRTSSASRTRPSRTVSSARSRRSSAGHGGVSWRCTSSKPSSCNVC
jgi:exodeoxyribonuclease-5